MKIKPALLLSITVLLIHACHENQTESEASDSLIRISRAQFLADSMATGTAEPALFEETIAARAEIKAASGAMAIVSVPINGIIRNIHCKPGQKVARGQVLFELSGIPLIDLQKEYAAAYATTQRVKGDFERMEALYKEQIGSRKDFILAESEYLAARANTNALKLKLELLGLDTVRIAAGYFYPNCPVLSPIQGEISKMTLILGQYAEPGTSLVEITDRRHLLLELMVFPEDLPRLREGQNVRFRMPGDQTMTYSAILFTIGVNVLEDTRAIACQALISDPDFVYGMKGLYTEAEIITHSDTLLSVPSDAVIKSENNAYLLKLVREDSSQYYFEKVSISTGPEHHKRIALRSGPVKDVILLKGTYNISAE
ncbi:MAG TPA: efflux RND transporter periplasmic adaptor subunit [Bacteroidales bacterium]|nr:efflux RND transporter periplasmic adaptor subunit [Bacteroidales bacterium]HSA42573.1 efflux RND transporter periplasmic adaptor subunit [Bacteroidales bacterium]